MIQRPVVGSVDAGLQLLPCMLPSYGVNGKFTQHANINLLGLFNYFWVYLSYQKRDQPIPNPF